MPQSSKRIEQLAPELDRIIATTQPIEELADGFGGARRASVVARRRLSRLQRHP
jgi:hypothetical protein